MQEALHFIQARQVQLLALLDGLIFMLVVFDLVDWSDTQMAAVTGFNALLLATVIGPQSVNEKQFVEALKSLSDHPTTAGRVPSDTDEI